ncbi:MAG: hypothetical protein LBT39_05825 [Treponema sp.]|nr:hypothetical protein [Treponema sp.]
MKKIFVLGILVLAMGMALNSCATFEVVNGQPQNLGIIAKSQLAERPVIASYWQIGPLLYGYNGIVNIGYDDFVSTTEGKSYDIQVKQYYFGMIAKVIAVEK